jgi:hypothetical protein
MTSRLGVSALVGLGVLVLGAGGFLVLGRSSASSAAPAPQIKPLHPVKKHSPVKPKAALAPPQLAAKMSRAPKHRPTVVGGVPAPLADALKHHSVVVLALVAPKSTVDQMTLGEAKAGAAAAHAGFVTVNVFDNAQVAALSALVGSSTAAQDRLLDAPAVLVFQQPRTLYVRLNGYADADTVRQAAVNAAPASQSS